jgi:hypothetical protein
MILHLTSGGDWTDAESKILVVPEGRNAEEDIKKYPGYRDCKMFLEFWLITEYGYREPTENEVVNYHDS